MPRRSIPKIVPLSLKDDQALGQIQAVLSHASREFGMHGTLRHAHILIQAGLLEAGSKPEGPVYRSEHWEALEVRRFDNGQPGRGMVRNFHLTDKGRRAIDRIVGALEG